MTANEQDFHFPGKKWTISFQGPHQMMVISKGSSQNHKNAVGWFLTIQKKCILYTY